MRRMKSLQRFEISDQVSKTWKIYRRAIFAMLFSSTMRISKSCLAAHSMWVPISTNSRKISLRARFLFNSKSISIKLDIKALSPFSCLPSWPTLKVCSILQMFSMNTKEIASVIWQTPCSSRCWSHAALSFIPKREPDKAPMFGLKKRGALS